MDLMHKRKGGKRARAKAFGTRMRKCGVKWRKKSDKFRATHKWTAFIKKHCR